MSLPRSHPPLKWMKNFKAVAIDYEYYLTLSDQPQSVCLTERQMYVLSVQNSYTYWLTRWYNTDDITQKTVELIAAEIEGLLMCGCGVPAPSFTDYINSASYVTTTQTTYNTTYNTWNDAGQTVASIAPNLDYSTGDPANIDKLMCLAYSLLIATIVQTAKNVQLGSEEDGKDLTRQLTAVFGGLATAGGAATLAGGAAAAVVAFFGGPALVLGLALAAVGTAIASLVWPTDTAVFDDEEAIENVYCTMVTNAVGVTPTRDVFQGALEPNDFAPDSHEAKLAAIIQPYLDDLNSYLQFIQLMSQMYDAVPLGLLPECGCEPPPSSCFDFVPDNAGWTAAVPGYATYTPDVGWSRGPSNARIYIMSPSMPSVTGITMRFNKAWDGTVVNFSEFSTEPHTDSGIEWTWIFDEPMPAGQFDLNFYISAGAPYVDADLVLLEICYFEL